MGNNMKIKYASIVINLCIFVTLANSTCGCAMTYKYRIVYKHCKIETKNNSKELFSLPRKYAYAHNSTYYSVVQIKKKFWFYL